MTPGETQSLLDDILLYYITTLDPLTMASLGGSVTDMVKFCTYDNVPCDMKYIQQNQSVYHAMKRSKIP